MDISKQLLGFRNVPVDVKSGFVDVYLKEISNTLKNNPAFIYELQRGLSMLTYKRTENDFLPVPTLIIAEDGKSFTIRGGVRPSPLVGNPYLMLNNRYYEQVKFTVADDGSLEVSTQMGTFYSVEAYKKNALANPHQSEIESSVLNYQGVNSVLDVDFERHVFSPEGIQMEYDKYSDKGPIGSSYTDEASLISQTEYHIPARWDKNVVPRVSVAYKPSLRMCYRMHNYALASFFQVVGKEGNISVDIHQIKTEYPEVLNIVEEPIFNVQNGRKIPTSYATENFPNANNENDIELMATEAFYAGLSGSRTATNNPALLNCIGSTVEETIKNMKESQLS